MTARLALPADIEQFVELAEIAHAESLPHVEYAEHKVRATFQRYLDSAHPTITVVDRKTGLAGLAGFCLQTISEYPSGVGLYTTAEVLFVRPDCRGTRAAAHLLRWFNDWSDNVIGALESTAGNDNQLRSENTAKLLSRFGFEPVGIFMRRRKGAAANGGDQKRRN